MTLTDEELAVRAERIRVRNRARRAAKRQAASVPGSKEAVAAALAKKRKNYHEFCINLFDPRVDYRERKTFSREFWWGS